MRRVAFAVGVVVAVAAAGCGKKGGGAGGGSGPFLEGTKTVPARLEWNRDFTSKNGGTVRFKVSSTAPFAVSVVTDAARQALVANNPAGFNKADVFLTADGQPPAYEGRVTVPAGKHWFIIENRSGAPADMRLECWDGD